jgi:hypothetical protein
VTYRVALIQGSHVEEYVQTVLREFSQQFTDKIRELEPDLMDIVDEKKDKPRVCIDIECQC